ncbi:uncharacterized protein LOC111352584 [Spodoptera litura]|uniref:Uncharacterized protein LOC111352584 n=1 Tax=Spodoptera litura TaxID=69820 RepID=A0A9J7IRS7_SPOLT|nr:uncharacterized protein LOC111352584 [Spodoptera litura]
MDCGYFIDITMKGGLCVIYTSLLTISVLSSCALFILVVSEALQGEGGVDTKVDLSGLHNVSQKVEVGEEEVPGSQLSPEAQLDEDQTKEDHEMIIAETLSLNSVTTEG